jgi:acetyltransferase-like isoleucine patch superfamily enzyme
MGDPIETSNFQVTHTLFRSAYQGILRRVRSACGRLGRAFSTFQIHLGTAGNPQIRIGENCLFGRNVKLSATDGGMIVIGKRVTVSDGVQLIARRGLLQLGDDVFVGTGTVLAACGQVSIGSETLLAEYVVIRDQDHRTDCRPIRSAGLLVSPIRVGRDVWVGAKATILRGATIGDGSVVGAHALVRGDVPPNTLAVGIPARLKSLG